MPKSNSIMFIADFDQGRFIVEGTSRRMLLRYEIVDLPDPDKPTERLKGVRIRAESEIPVGMRLLNGDGQVIVPGDGQVIRKSGLGCSVTDIDGCNYPLFRVMMVDGGTLGRERNDDAGAALAFYSEGVRRGVLAFDRPRYHE